MKTILAVILLTLSTTVAADVKNHTFEPPIEREDGTALTLEEIAHFNVYVNGEPVKTVPNNVTSFSVELTHGTHEVKMTTVDTDGRESLFSNVIQEIIVSKPKAPVIIVITIPQ